MNNEPVAWLLFRDGGESYPEYTNSYKQMREWETYLGDNERIEPHYTHPAKTLTDEEIYQTWVEAKNTALNTRGSDFVEVIFARAILKKASEK
jgi:hypothetical protein